MTASPSFRVQGRGEGVVCLHSNASSSGQWRALSSALADRYRVFAVDGYGVGESPEWPVDLRADLDHEVALLEPVFAEAGPAFHLVGHSYGAAVALLAAVRFPRRVRSLAVYEPTLFALVAGDDPGRSPAAGIWHAATDAAEAVASGEPARAAARFIDFWTASGTFAAMPEPRRDAVVHAIRHVRRWRDALVESPLAVAELARLDVPVLLMWGDRSPESSSSVARVLAATLPRVTLAPEPGLGHMGPITDPARVNARIAAFLDSLSSPGAPSRA